MAACSCKQEKGNEIRFRKVLRKLAKEIINQDVTENHILDRLEMLIQCEISNQERFERKQPYSVELYLHHENQGRNGISLLHLAISCNRVTVATRLVEVAPDLCKIARMDKSFKGQTPFHIAVANMKEELVAQMLRRDVPDKRELLSGKARGRQLKGTKMTGELPLSIVVINCDENMLRLLLEEGADAMLGDSNGNTILHTIVMYGHFFPEKNTNTELHFKQAFESFKEAWGRVNSTTPSTFLRTLLQKRNDKMMTPMQMACQKGISAIFEYFVKLDDINIFKMPEWGVDDAHCYDVTELDTVRWREVVDRDETHKYPEKPQNVRDRDEEWQSAEDCFDECIGKCTRPGKINKRMSAFQIISNLPFKKATDFMATDVVEELLKKKWMYYKWWFRGFLLFHLIVMILLIFDTIEKTKAFRLNTVAFGNKLDRRYMTFNVFNMIVGLLYILQEIVRTFHFRQSWRLLTSTHRNTICRLVFLLFGLTLFVDALWNFGNVNNYMRYLAIFFGCFDMLFFLRAIKLFSYHSVIFLEILCGDIIKFFPVVIIIFVPFIPAAYEAYGSRGAGFRTPSETMLTLVVQGPDNLVHSFLRRGAGTV